MIGVNTGNTAAFDLRNYKVYTPLLTLGTESHSRGQERFPKTEQYTV